MNTCAWAIVGGGIHGVHLGARLVGEGVCRPEDLTIIDPGTRLLHRWRRCTAATGMTHLRSPAVHHLDRDPSALTAFAGPRKRRPRRAFAPPYNRPSLALFNAHCDHVVHTYRLGDRHVCASAEHAHRDGEHTVLTLSQGGPLRARNVVLAMGAGGQLAWAAGAPRGHPRVHHVFAPDFDPHVLDRSADGEQRSTMSRRCRADDERLIVVGGGITAAQVALRAHRSGHTVDVVAPGPPDVHQFDSDPSWLGPKYMTRFSAEQDLGRRRSLIVEARHRGSVPPDVERAVTRAMGEGGFTWQTARAERIAPDAPGVRVVLDDGRALSADRVVLATGFAGGRPGGQLIDDLVHDEALPCAACGFPIVDRALQWRPGLFTTGPLAELELGPAARNIAGARRAADRIVDHARHRARAAVAA